MWPLLIMGLFTTTLVQNANSLDDDFDTKAFLVENFDTVSTSLTSIQAQLSSQTGPIDSRLLVKLNTLEESDRSNKENFKKIHEQLEKITTMVTTCSNDQSSATSIDALNLKIQVLEMKLEAYESKGTEQVATSATTIAAMSKRINDLDTKQQEQFSELRQSMNEGKERLATSVTKIAAMSESINDLDSTQSQRINNLDTKQSQRINDLVTKQQELQGKTDDVPTKEQFNELRLQIAQAGQPSTGLIAFNCYRTSSLSGEADVTYNDCDVDTTGGAMDKNTGRFTAKKSGIYKFQFHSLIKSGKDAWVLIKKGSQVITHLGGGGANSGYGHISGGIITELEVGQEVYARLDSTSYHLHSTQYRYTVFQGFFLAAM